MKATMSNGQIGRMLSTLSELIQLHGHDDYQAKAFAGAAYKIRRIAESVFILDKPALEKALNRTTASKIEELKKTGTIEMLDELIQLTPSGIFEMMRIKGLGGKKLSLLWRKGGIENMDELYKACKSGKLEELGGFGKKTTENIIGAIEDYRNNSKQLHYASVEDEAEHLVELMRKIFKTILISLCGEVRRKCNVVDGIEMVAAITQQQFKANKAVVKFLVIQSASSTTIKAHTINETPVTIYFSTADDFYYDLFVRTGNEEHVKKVSSKIRNKNKKYKSEEAIYTAAGLPFIPPELRENLAEWSFSSAPEETLIRDEDIKGVVHNHTNWSDGIDTLKNFVLACKEKGYEYTVISDHSKNAHYAGGLKEEKVIRQHAEIDSLNKSLAPFKIFKSIECDILVSGELDYPNDFLKRFDLVIISVHQLLKMNEEKATARLLRAIKNPFTTILGHMTGRQLLIRPGYPVDFKKVIDACAANKVIIEINANPYRLDVDYSHIPYALSKGVMISVNPDAHSIGEIDNIHWGIVSARKGGLTKEMTWNAMSLADIEKWLKKKKAATRRK
jgi:DNA polymerase (family 10)